MSIHKNLNEWIVFEDGDYYVINKPPFVSTLQDRAGAVSVLDLAMLYCNSSQVCHRLDKETSGILLIAKNPAAYRHANMQFADRTVEKTYHAIADGIHDFTNYEVDLPLQVAGNGLVRINKRLGKPSITYVTTLKKYAQHTLVACKPVTGRMHQIRVHLSSIGAPLVADLDYGGKDLLLSNIKRKYKLKTTVDERPLLARVALHSYSLKFVDMSDKAQLINCSYPKDFRTAINQLEKNS